MLFAKNTRHTDYLPKLVSVAQCAFRLPRNLSLLLRFFHIKRQRTFSRVRSRPPLPLYCRLKIRFLTYNRLSPLCNLYRYADNCQFFNFLKPIRISLYYRHNAFSISICNILFIKNCRFISTFTAEMLLQPFLLKEKTRCDIIPLIERNKKRLRSGKCINQILQYFQTIIFGSTR